MKRYLLHLALLVFVAGQVGCAVNPGDGSNDPTLPAEPLLKVLSGVYGANQLQLVENQLMVLTSGNTLGSPTVDPALLGPRLPRGHRLTLPAWGAVGLHERHLYDDKLICAAQPLTPAQQKGVLVFFRFYARCKGLLNLLRRQPGPSYCSGWGSAEDALARTSPVTADWRGPRISF